jgi:signal transduction histidine kinase
MVESAFHRLARRRVLGVGLALVAEICLVAALTLAPAPVEAGIPGVMAAAIAGTVAVVFGAVDGVMLALAGALTFGVLDGWSVGAAAALVVWPSVVGIVGLFGQHVERQRDLLRQILSEHEQARRRMALDLHDEQAQVLAGALMMLRAASDGEDTATSDARESARSLISETIAELRSLAADLSPRALERQGLYAALKQLEDGPASASGASIQVDGGFSGRLTFEAELALYRVAHDTVTSLIERGERDIRVTLEHTGDTVMVSIACDGATADQLTPQAHTTHRERLRLLGGRLHTVPSHGHLIRAEVPALLEPEAS